MTFSFRSAAAVAVLAITTFGAAAPALAQSDVGAAKFFEVRFSPELAAPMNGFKYTVVVKNNELSRQTLGAVNLTAPDGFDLGGTTLGAIVKATEDGKTSQTVQLRDLALRPGETRELTITANNGGGDADSTWKAAGRQANKFSGEGNAFVLLPEFSSLRTGVDAVFTEPCQENVECKLEAQWQGSGPTYSHTLPDVTSQSRQSTSLPELPRTDLSTQNGTMNYTVTVTVTALPNDLPGGDAGTLSLKIDATAIDCLIRTETSPVTALVNFVGDQDTSLRAKTVAFTVDGTADLPRSEGMCFGAPVPFVAAPLTARQYGDSLFFTGTLPDCETGQPQESVGLATPCTSVRKSINGNQRTVASVPARPLDPAYRP